MNLPYPNQAPGDDLAHALSLLNLADIALDQVGSVGLDRETVMDVHVALNEARSVIKPVLRFLEALPIDEPTHETYRQARVAHLHGSAKLPNRTGENQPDTAAWKGACGSQKRRSERCDLDAGCGATA